MNIRGPRWLSLLHPGRLPVDGFVLALAAVVVAATVLPCRGETAVAFHAAGIAAIAALFFLQGARLSRDAILRGVTHWRLHAAIGATTFVLFPLLGLGLLAMVPSLLPQTLWPGVLFVCALPSTVQSSIALTSIAQGNVPGAVCSATVSNIAGIVLAPLLFGAMSHLHGGGIDLTGLWGVMLQLLVPFAAGHLARPWIGAWAERSRAVLGITDRGSILLVVYAAFSAAVVHGIWRQMPPVLLVELLLVMVCLLGLVMLLIRLASGALGFSRGDEAALLFCGSQKSLVSGVPIANALVSGAAIGPILLPIMLYYPMQVCLCAWIARRYADSGTAGGEAVPGPRFWSREDRSSPRPIRADRVPACTLRLQLSGVGVERRSQPGGQCHEPQDYLNRVGHRRRRARGRGPCPGRKQ